MGGGGWRGVAKPSAAVPSAMSPQAQTFKYSTERKDAFSKPNLIRMILSVIVCFRYILHMVIWPQTYSRGPQRSTREEGRRDRFYLTSHDRFYLWLYGIGHIAKNNSDSERGNSATTSLATFPVSSKRSFYMHHSTEDSIYHNLCYPVANQWLE